jgi:hypothetical protein
MKLANILKSVTPLEGILFVLFVLYIIFPIGTPAMIAPMIDSSLGMLAIFCITVALFLYVNPILAILYIFVAYELLRRSANVTNRAAIIEYTPSQKKIDQDMAKMNKPQQMTLEEVVIAERAPITGAAPSVFVETSFKPVNDKVAGSMYA